MNLILVLSTGRAGSTTILDMLNAIPQIALAGELHLSHAGGDKSVLRLLMDAFALSLHPGVTGQKDESRFAQPDQQKLRQHLLEWVRDMRPSRPEREYYGFKELIQNFDVSRFLSICNCSSSVRMVRNYRNDVAAQSQSGFHGIGGDQTTFNTWSAHSFGIGRESSSNKWKASALARLTEKFKKDTQAVRHFDLPLERFSVHQFNTLLSFLGIRDCAYTRVLHGNANNSYIPDRSTHGLLKGNCVSTGYM